MNKKRYVAVKQESGRLASLWKKDKRQRLRVFPYGHGLLYERIHV
ncbi:hypothetical protein P9597_13495 [Aneurinibacillus migulanus]|nr:hypothetical protein [Aneurinibacillus migulanus]